MGCLGYLHKKNRLDGILIHFLTTDRNSCIKQVDKRTVVAEDLIKNGRDLRVIL